jgi:CRISPR/Cas system CMR subunit Cmr6 (Cas7 group RAMP superfamily)
LISSVIVDASPSHDSSTPFYFLTVASVVSFGVVVLFVDLRKSRVEQEEFLEEERRARMELEVELEVEDINVPKAR